MRVSKKHDVRLNEILDAAELLFTQKGYEQATVNDILDKVEIGKGTFYHYFKSKEDVMAGVIRRIAEGLVEKARAVAADNTLSAPEKMKSMLSAVSLSGNTGEAVLEELHRPANERMHLMSIVEAVRGIAPVMAEVIQQGVSEGVYHTPYPLETMEFLLASTQFFFVDAVFQWKPEELATRVKACVRIIELSLGAAEGSFRFLSGALGPESGETAK
ncbi:MAG: TetR/AcrR family transcriptional regulator [Spirochaetaceae bacterium]|jgi:AcrR family transcriptional regulator|nr:TetR/AcrR family transcriptional regulator [Spirochaetaceae bacterium]